MARLHRRQAEVAKATLDEREALGLDASEHRGDERVVRRAQQADVDLALLVVPSRDIAAAPERVGELLDGLGSEGDRFWPGDRWPTTPFELDGPLAVGTPSRQGQIRQVVEEYEPGRRIVLRFAPGLGLLGTHRLEVEPLARDRTRLAHTLDCRVEPRLIALYPILIRQHDALVEDLLDRAELLATGRLSRPAARWPLAVRVANAIELRLRRVGGGRPRRRATSAAA